MRRALHQDVNLRPAALLRGSTSPLRVVFVGGIDASSSSSRSPRSSVIRLSSGRICSSITPLVRGASGISPICSSYRIVFGLIPT